VQKSLLFFLFLAAFGCMQAPAYSRPRPISLDPENPHYFLYHGKPVVLITSGEHYGAVINLDFDYNIYLNTLKSDGLNLTRTFSGAYVESSTSFNITHNTLAPASDRFICPWQRVSDRQSYKFDLSKWDPAYFRRLRQFVAAARKHGVIVEFTLFCPFYEEEQWNLSPLNERNNINGVGKVARTDVYTLDKSGKLLAIQEAMVRKIVTELKSFDNVMYEICNEPYFGGVTLEWQRHMAEVIAETEGKGQGQHLITQNISNGAKKITDPFPMVSVFNFHYASPPDAVAQNYGLNKVIGNNETGFKGNKDATYRTQGWHFILAGGGLFNNLDYSFTAGEERGTYQYPSTQPGGGSVALRKQLGFLKDFMDHFDFIRMHPDTGFIKSGLPPKADFHALAEPGKQYALYLTGASGSRVEAALPAGIYEATWIDPQTNAVISKETVTAGAGPTWLNIPTSGEDIALRLLRSGK